MFAALTDFGVTGRAIKQGVIDFAVVNPRDFTHDKHRTVDDRPYGGGPGMLMKTAPLVDAIQCAREQAKETGHKVLTIYLSPTGHRLDQKWVDALATQQGLILVCGRYEGIDQRVIEREIDVELSIGDFVVSGGELPAMILLDAVLRQVPGVLGHEASAVEDSYSGGLLDCPHFTRPAKDETGQVPQVLLSGDHAKIARWRRKQALGRTWEWRPELLKQISLSEADQNLLDEYIEEFLRRKI
ncbi:MAG: tRNA (guanosine(37)-N1)-methyltransferase TrmD [Gammaproteobacteria bacterium]|nr:MAG: tRNA (guanosine(37)-N1)-methyltransferase TrmD [Gammaproteobacteria bacterium]